MTASTTASIPSLLPVAARCPREGSWLVPRMLDELEYLACETCGGLWIPSEQLPIMALRVAGGAPAPRSPQHLEPSRIFEGTARCVCPKAPLMLNVEAMAITLDRCEACGGIWLDGGEIRRVIEHHRGERRSSAGSLGELPGTAFDGFDAGDLLLVLLDIVGAFLDG